MVEKELSIAEMVRRNGCDDDQMLAQIERAEYIAELIHSAYRWVTRGLSILTQEISGLFHRHAH